VDYVYGTLWAMSRDRPGPESGRLTATSYLVLGLLAREGPSTPYDLKRLVAATYGHLWPFPHAILYKEPARLVERGLVTEERETEGRRRRLFTITPAGREVLREWLRRPARQPTELRDLGLLQFFFADLEPTSVRLAIAEEQLAQHRARLAAYEAARPSDDGRGTGDRSIQQWREVTLPMGLRFERAAIEFWAGVASDVREEDRAIPKARAEDDGGTVAGR
jgi:PadR family transcriptional regulator, regulatory protein AphA